MRSDNLQLPCVQTPTSSSYNFQLPHGHDGRHGHGGHDVICIFVCITDLYNGLCFLKVALSKVQDPSDGQKKIAPKKVPLQ